MEQDPESFLRTSAGMLSSEADSPGLQQLLRLLAGSERAMRRICDPGFLGAEQSVELARRIAEVDPQFDATLLRLLPRADAMLGNPSAVAVGERVLSLIEAASSSARIVPALAHLLHNPDPRLRAKATLMLGRRVRNAQFVEGRLEEVDRRVRANAIESVWGGDAHTFGPVFWGAVADKDNRVAGNALLGLYQAQDGRAISRILSMAADSRPLFRATAAWVMGQTADPRFLPAVEKLARDLYASVRRSAAPALKRIGGRAATEARVELNILRVEERREGRCSVSLQALDPGGAPVRGLAPSHFVVWRGDQLVTEYEVVEHDSSDPIAAGFAICREGAGEAVTTCLSQKPPGHLWNIRRFAANAQGAPAAALPAYLADAKSLQTALSAPAAESCPFRSLLPGLLRIDGARSLIFLADEEFAPAGEAEPQIALAIENRVAIHAVVTGLPGEALKSICERTGGILTQVADMAGAGAALGKLYSALSNRYCIRYAAPAEEGGREAAARIEVWAAAGHGDCLAG